MTDSFLVRVRRPDGLQCLLRVEGDRLQDLMDIAHKHFGVPGLHIGGPMNKVLRT